MRFLPGWTLIVTCVLLPFRGTGAINVSEAIEIGGIQQWISLKGDQENGPVILFLHGGPGSSAMAHADAYTRELQKHFVVVQWDQRETGKTKGLNSTPVPLTVALMENDTFEMIRYLCERFSKDKIYIVGHSWGGFLGWMAAAKHPELIAGYFAINPMVHQVESEQESLNVMKAKAKKENNQPAIDELAQVQVPFQNGEQLYFHRKWLANLMGTKPVSRSFVEAWAKTWLAVFNTAADVDFRIEAPEIKCPVYFFLGDHDYQTYYRIAEDYFKKLKAVKKELIWFTGSDHLIPQTEPGKMQELIIRTILK
jgi:pimeloyl-ACP methyl ester carboxylesterase